MTPPGRPAQKRLPDPGVSSRNETIAGLVLLGLSLVGALVIGLLPGPNALDRWGFSVLTPSPHSTFFLRILHLGGLLVLVGGSVLAGLLVIGVDRRRAIACVCGPLVAAVLVDWVIKPYVGRRYIGELCFPSGSVTVVAALSTSWILAVPRRLRWPAIVVGATLVSLMSIAVVVVRWHYPSDALAGAIFAVGIVLLCDGLLHVPRLKLSRNGRQVGPESPAGSRHL